MPKDLKYTSHVWNVLVILFGFAALATGPGAGKFVGLVLIIGGALNFYVVHKAATLFQNDEWLRQQYWRIMAQRLQSTDDHEAMKAALLAEFDTRAPRTAKPGG